MPKSKDAMDLVFVWKWVKSCWMPALYSISLVCLQLFSACQLAQDGLASTLVSYHGAM